MAAFWVSLAGCAEAHGPLARASEHELSTSSPHQLWALAPPLGFIPIVPPFYFPAEGTVWWAKRLYIKKTLKSYNSRIRGDFRGHSEVTESNPLSHFTEEKIEAQRGEILQVMTELGLKPRSSDSRVRALSIVWWGIAPEKRRTGLICLLSHFLHMWENDLTAEREFGVIINGMILDKSLTFSGTQFPQL